LRESAAESRFEALRSEAAPLIGREQELELLLRHWAEAKAGEGRAVLISGEPGIGKSRLTAALAQAVESDQHTRLRYFCSPHHQDSALHPFIVQLERAAGFVRDDAVDRKLEKLRGLLALGAHGEDEIALVAELLSLPNAVAELNLSPQRKREKLFEALLNQLEFLARSGSVLMVFEDAHWIDPTSREFLDLTLDRVSGLRILLVVTFRPEFQHAWSGRPQISILALNRLGGRDGAALVERLAGNAGLSRETVEEIVERADGVPLFVEELTKAVVESGDLDNRVGAVLAASPLPNLAIPAALHASLIARLDRLGPTAKEIAQIGAVIGREFSDELIRPVAQRRESDLDAALDRLTDAGYCFAAACRRTLSTCSSMRWCKTPPMRPCCVLAAESCMRPLAQPSNENFPRRWRPSPSSWHTIAPRRASPNRPSNTGAAPANARSSVRQIRKRSPTSAAASSCSLAFLRTASATSRSLCFKPLL
jgi:predicted ATPase